MFRFHTSKVLAEALIVRNLFFDISPRVIKIKKKELKNT